MVVSLGKVDDFIIRKGELVNEKAALNFSLRAKHLTEVDKRHISSNWSIVSEQLDPSPKFFFIKERK